MEKKDDDVIAINIILKLSEFTINELWKEKF
jgi:hypothetical protein